MGMHGMWLSMWPSFVVAFEIGSAVGLFKFKDVHFQFEYIPLEGHPRLWLRGSSLSNRGKQIIYIGWIFHESDPGLEPDPANHPNPHLILSHVGSVLLPIPVLVNGPVLECQFQKPKLHHL